MTHSPRLSIRTRALLLLCTIFLVVLGMLTYFAYRERQDDLAVAMAALQAQADRIAREQKRILDYAQDTVTLLTELGDLDRFGATEQCHHYLAGIVEQEPRIALVALVSPDGDITCSSALPGRTVNVADRAYFKQALAHDRLVIEEAFWGRLSKKWSLPVAKAVRGRDGRVRAVLVVSVDLGWLARDLAHTQTEPGARVGLIDNKGVVLARDPDPEQWLSRSAAHTPFFATLLAHGGIGTAEAPGFDDVTRIYGFARFADTTAGPIHLWVGMPKDAVLRHINRDFYQSLAVVLTMLVTAFIAIWISSERLILRPTQAIIKTVRRLSHGEHDARTGLRYTDDELGELARSVDEMAYALVSKSEILRLNRALRVLSACNKVLVRAGDEDQLLQEICRTIVEAGGYRMAWVGFADSDPQQTVRPVAEYGYEEGYLNTIQISWGDNALGHGPTGTAIRTGSVQTNQNFATNPALAPWREDALKRGYQASAALPLRDNERVFGALTVYAAEHDAFGADELALLEELAEDTAYGIRMLRLRAGHDESEAKLERGMESTIQAIASMLEMRDPYTAGHEQRVAKLAVTIGQELGLSADELRGLHFACVVHDIGKIQVPAEILVKPTRLTEVEYQLVKQHVRASYDILKDVEFPWPIAELVYQHHERIDGSGYPRGLKGEEILLGARIMAVADTIESMASHRPYRAALGINAALREIREHRGKLYDPMVVDAVDKLFAEKRFSFE